MPCHAEKKGFVKMNSIWRTLTNDIFMPNFTTFIRDSWRIRSEMTMKLVLCVMSCRTKKSFVKVRQKHLFLTNFDELWRIDESWYRFRDRYVINPTKFVIFRHNDEYCHFDAISCRIHLSHSSSFVEMDFVWKIMTNYSKFMWRIMTNYYKSVTN